MSDEKKTESNIPSLGQYNYFLFSKDVEPCSVSETIAFILERNLMKKRPDAIRLVINSQGGELQSGFALIDVMEASKVPIYTYGLGSLCSAALTIFITGTRGKRFITRNTSILSHQFSWANYGKEHELIASVKEIDLTQKRMMEHYKKYTKLSEANIKKLLMPPEDCWLSAPEAVKYGIADCIMKSFA
jgi:ATP-dependent Clp protease protease subunit